MKRRQLSTSSHNFTLLGLLVGSGFEFNGLSVGALLLARLTERKTTTKSEGKKNSARSQKRKGHTPTASLGRRKTAAPPMTARTKT